MCGMAREFGDPGPLVAEMLEASDRSGMPVDARLWLAAPPRSSYPACIAVKAAAEQGDPSPYLRRLREGLLCRRRKLDTTDALIEEGCSVPGLDLERLRFALGSHEVLEAFGADLDRAVPAEHHSPGTGRVKLPSLEFRGPDGEVHGVYGSRVWGALDRRRAAAVRRDGHAGGGAAVCDLPGPRAPAELWRLAVEWRVRAERVGSGELWSLA
jgi:hypothetical protein